MKKLVILLGVLGICYLFVNGNTIVSSLREQAPNNENIYLALKTLNVKYADVVYAQIMLESANLHSKLFKTNNNLMGMKHPKRRETTSLGSRKGYARYEDWYSCVQDYLLYQNDILEDKHMSKKQYIAYLGKKYATDKHYIAKLKNKMKENKILVTKIDSVYSNNYLCQN
jgi:uncharacterized FlgJ-related protein